MSSCCLSFQQSRCGCEHDRLASESSVLVPVRRLLRPRGTLSDWPGRDESRERVPGLHCARHRGCACATAYGSHGIRVAVLKIRVPTRLCGARSGDFRLSSGKGLATKMLEQLPPLERRKRGARSYFDPCFRKQIILILTGRGDGLTPSLDVKSRSSAMLGSSLINRLKYSEQQLQQNT
jgi:hypothetical protein